MKVYQETWLEKLQEFTSQWNKPLMANNVLGVCCDIVGDDSGDTDVLTQELARILRDILAEKLVKDKL